MGSRKSGVKERESSFTKRTIHAGKPAPPYMKGVAKKR
jgi:hypothetical protein